MPSKPKHKNVTRDTEKIELSFGRSCDDVCLINNSNKWRVYLEAIRVQEEGNTWNKEDLNVVNREPFKVKRRENHKTITVSGQH